MARWSRLGVAFVATVAAACGSSGEGAGSSGGTGTGAGGGATGDGGTRTGVAAGPAYCPYTPSLAGLPDGSPAGKSLAGAVAPYFPQCTSGFALTDATHVRGSGTSLPPSSNWFWGDSGAAYDIVVDQGAMLATFVDNTKGAADLTAAAAKTNTPNQEVIAISAGSLENHGVLATYPSVAQDKARNYNQTSPVVWVDNDAAHPVSVVNYGQIGVKVSGSFATDDPLSGYGQFNANALLIAGNGSIINKPGAYMGGYITIFTFGAGTIDNFGTIAAIGDGMLTGYDVTNHEGGAIVTGTMGYACIHAYGKVDNYGYMLGKDYALLADKNNAVINDYAGGVVPGVVNFDGSPVYDGEISALVGGKPNDAGPYLASDAILLNGDAMTVNLIARTIGGALYLPVIVGPMVGGFNGTYSSATDHKVNTLNLQLDGITAADATALRAAINATKQSNAKGEYYGGKVTVLGHTYHFEDFAMVQFTGTTN
jgi:hypothetical protein